MRNASLGTRRKEAWRLIIEAGNLALKFFRKGVFSEKKQAGGFVTVADSAVNDFIVSEIVRLFPGDGILSEELPKPYTSHNGFRWIVDPIDGTTNFKNGCSDFAVSLALAHRSAICLGLVYAPYRGDLFSAEAGRGAEYRNLLWRETSRLRVSCTASPEQAVIEFCAAHERKGDAARELKLIGCLYPGIRLRMTESASLALCKVACGQIDAYFQPNERPYDYAAGALVAREAGGRVTSVLRNRLWLGRAGILASNGVLHGALMAHIAKVYNGQ